MKWTKQELQDHIRENIWSIDKSSEEIHGYGGAIVAAALYEKIYGERPSLGLSGFQGEAVKSVLKSMPNAES